MSKSKSTNSFALDQLFTHKLHRLAKLTDKATQTAYDERIGLPHSEGRCLSAIGTVGAAGLSVNALAELSNLTKGQASRAASTLIERGLVRKEDSPSDGRGVVLTLTAEGRKVCDAVFELVQKRNEEILKLLTTTERKQLASMFDRLIAGNL
jgi:DNA-binding MarR family transcriptional regulator